MDIFFWGGGGIEDGSRNFWGGQTKFFIRKLGEARAVASPAQKKWGSEQFFLLVSSKKLQYTCMGPPPPPHI